MTLAARLLSAMRRRGIRSQNQLARLSGVSQPSVHRILADPQGYVPGRRIVARLAQALDMSEAWLADGCLPDSASAPLAHSPHPAPEPVSDTNRLVALYAHLTPSQRALVLDLTRMLLEAGGTSLTAPFQGSALPISVQADASRVIDHTNTDRTRSPVNDQADTDRGRLRLAG